MPITNLSVLPRFIFVLKIFGTSFTLFQNLSSVLMDYVYQKSKSGDDRDSVSLPTFEAEANNLLTFLPSSTNSFIKEFRDLHEIGLQRNTPTGCLLISNRTTCRSCKKKLFLDKKTHVITVYHALLGCFIGSRATKYCKTCKIYEHYGYWSQGAQKHYDGEALENEYLLSTEETAMDISLLNEFSSLLVVGALPFATFAHSYNRRFGLKNKSSASANGLVASRSKRQKTSTQSIVLQRSCLDRRRLEDAFLLYATLQIMSMHSISIPYFPCSRNELIKLVTDKYHTAFVKKWGGHVCSIEGCKNVLVLDGNMKNCRQICSCKNVTELEFEGLKGCISVGCLKTPSKGSKQCEDHSDRTMTFRDDSQEMYQEQTRTLPQQRDNDSNDDLLPIKICNEKETRSGKFFEVLWSDGRKSWIKESNLPKHVGATTISVEEFGQKRRALLLLTESQKENKDDNVFKSTGFGVERVDDNEVIIDGSKEHLNCQTEKGKQKSKRNKSAGILVFEKPCGVVLDVRELFGSESKSQVYGHLHTLLRQEHMSSIDVICYDDACHLKKFCVNPVRKDDTPTSRRLSTMDIVCDRFHYKNHVGKWCKKNCNPYSCTTLEKVNTEVCEQLFSWLSKFSTISKHMNRYRFMFLMLYVLEQNNLDIV